MPFGIPTGNQAGAEGWRGPFFGLFTCALYQGSVSAC